MPAFAERIGIFWANESACGHAIDVCTHPVGDNHILEYVSRGCRYTTGCRQKCLRWAHEVGLTFGRLMPSKIMVEQYARASERQ